VKVHIARALRRNLTDAERWLWNQLRDRKLAGCKFRRQHPIGPFIGDFVCIEKKLVIEVDGGQHAEDACSDEKRANYLKEEGYQILRFWNNQVFDDGESVLEEIVCRLMEKSPSPSPLPRGRGRGG